MIIASIVLYVVIIVNMTLFFIDAQGKGGGEERKIISSPSLDLQGMKYGSVGTSVFEDAYVSIILHNCKSRNITSFRELGYYKKNNNNNKIDLLMHLWTFYTSFE